MQTTLSLFIVNYAINFLHHVLLLQGLQHRFNFLSHITITEGWGRNSFISWVTSCTSYSKLTCFLLLAHFTIAHWIRMSRSCLMCLVTFFSSSTLKSKSTVESTVSKFQLKLKNPRASATIRVGKSSKNRWMNVFSTVRSLITLVSSIFLSPLWIV